MKKVFFLLLAVFALTAASCDRNEPQKDLPQINLEQHRYALAKNAVEVRLVADEPATSAIVVPVTFAGTAVEGTDFTVSPKEFTFKAGEKEAVIVITRIEENIGDEEKSLTINLGTAPDGYKIGTMNFTTVEFLSNQSIIMTFVKDEDILTENSEFAINLQKIDGSFYRVPAETNFDVEVDPASTAVEGTHFEFTGGKYVTIPRNRNTGSVGIKFLKKETGKDKLVLRLKKKDGYSFGSNDIITITIQGPYTFNGTWAFDKISNLEWWKTSWGLDVSNFPKGTSADKITFAGNSHAEYTFTPNITGDLKNYFTTATKATYKGEVSKVFQELSSTSAVRLNVAVLEFETVNVNFSPTNTKLRKAVVGFRTITVDGKEILECTIDDFEPTDFLKDTYDFMKDFGENPVMLSGPLRVHFTRIQ